MLTTVFTRISRWINQEGLRGSYRKIKYILRYWHFRMWIRRLRNSTLHRADIKVPMPRQGSPLFSILLPAYRTRPSWLLQAVNSVREQAFENWELCIGLYGVSSKARVELKQLALQDSRIRIFDLNDNLGISGNANHLANEAHGEFLAVLDHDDYLEPHALSEVATKMRSQEFDLLYTDEDIVSPWLRLPAPPNLKPDWAPEHFLSANYICHFCCYRRELFNEVGGFRSEYDGAQDYDLFLRLSEKTNRIAHIPKVLYHWRRHGLSTASGADGGAKPAAWEAARLAVQSHLQRLGGNASVEMGKAYGTLRVRYARSEDPLIDIIIPSANRNDTLMRCLRSIVERTGYPNFRVTVMMNGGGNFSEVRNVFDADSRFRFRSYEGTFNFSRINNIPAMESECEVLLFLNDDIEITDPFWLESLLEQAQRKEIGAVGPMLLYPDGTVQHAGIAVYHDDIAWEFHKRLLQNSDGYHSRLQIIQNVSAVTGACLCTRKDCFLETGGFDETLPLAYNDVDYCLKLLEKGYRIVYNPFVRLIHHESLTRGLDLKDEASERLRQEGNRMRKKWGIDGLQEHYFDAGLFKQGADLRKLAGEYLNSSPLMGQKSSHD